MMNIKTEEYKNYVLERINTFNKSSRPTIIFVNDAYYPIIDGVVNLVENYAQSLCKYFNIVIAVPATKNILEIKDIKNKNLLILGCKSSYFRKINYSKATPRKDKFFIKILNQLNKIKLIHLHSPYYLGHFMLSFAKQKNIQVVSTFHSLYKKDLLINTHSKLVSFFVLK